MKITLVAAVAENRVIGKDGGLPWRLPDEMAHFRRVTMGKPIVMGRATWESLGRPLPGRLNVVLTRDAGYVAAGATVVASLDEALAVAAASGAEEAMVIGGATVYAEALPRADALCVTHVEAAPEGDTWFPEIDPRAWRAHEETRHPPDARHAVGFRIVRYERVE